MLKIFLLLGIVIICGYIGFYLAKKYSLRVKQLELCELMLIKIKVYIECENMKTAEVISRLAQADSLKNLTFLRICETKLLSDKNFPEMWCESLDESSREPAQTAQSALAKSDYDTLKQLAEVVGVCDSDGVADSIEVIKREIAQAKEQATMLNQTNGSLCRKLGILAGIGIAIIFI